MARPWEECHWGAYGRVRLMMADQALSSGTQAVEHSESQCENGRSTNCPGRPTSVQAHPHPADFPDDDYRLCFNIFRAKPPPALPPPSRPNSTSPQIPSKSLILSRFKQSTLPALSKYAFGESIQTRPS